VKVVRITGKRKAELVDRPEPKPSADFVVVKVHVAPMCTEYKAFDAGTQLDGLGHEAVGEVVEVAQPGKVCVGDRVVVMPQYPCGKCRLCISGDYVYCRDVVDPLALCGCEAGTATYSQYVLKQDWLLVPIPDDISYEHAGMACCGLGPTFGAMNLIEVDAFDTVLVTGMGPVGLGGLINAGYRGARVIAVECHPYRARLARALGAMAVIHPADEDALDKILGLTGGVGVDKGVECAGAAPAQRLLIDAARPKAKVAFVGEAGELTIAVSDEMLRKGLTLVGSWHWNLSDAPRMIDIIRASSEKLDVQITHKFPMSRVQEAFELQLSGDCGKVLLYPWR